MIVFAGGPHTPERTQLACELLTNRPPPAIIYLTGTEYRSEYSNCATRISATAAVLPGRPTVITDTCPTTWASCLNVVSDIKARHPEGAIITVVTSNYHALRARWLLTGILQSRYPVILMTSPDIPWRGIIATKRNRQLARGELLSWTYCLPLGLILHPTMGALFLSLVVVVILGYRRAKARTSSSSTPLHRTGV